MNKLKFWLPEIFAYLCAAVSILFGFILNATSTSVSYLTPAGSLIIIVGVLLGLSRKYERLSVKTKEFASSHIYSNFEKILSEASNKSEKMFSESEKKEYVKELIGGIAKDIDEVISEKKNWLKWHEIFLVCAGTFINGFGDLLFKLLSASYQA